MIKCDTFFHMPDVYLAFYLLARKGWWVEDCGYMASILVDSHTWHSLYHPTRCTSPCICCYSYFLIYCSRASRGGSTPLHLHHPIPLHHSSTGQARMHHKMPLHLSISPPCYSPLLRSLHHSQAQYLRWDLILKKKAKLDNISIMGILLTKTKN